MLNDRSNIQHDLDRLEAGAESNQMKYDGTNGRSCGSDPNINFSNVELVTVEGRKTCLK